MKAGVSTACLYPNPVEEALYQLAVNGVSCVEVFLNTPSELKKSFAHGIADILKRFDVSCASLHPFTCEMETLMLFSDYERRLRDSLELHRRYFDFMNIVGAEIFVLHGAKAGVTKERYCERYSQLYRLGKEFGVTVAVENVSRCLSSSSAFIRDISRMLGDEFAFVLDTKQAIRSGETPFSFLDAAGSKLCHVHISDSGPLGDCLPIGKGSFRFDEFFRRLSNVSPGCHVILELYRNNFDSLSELLRSSSILTAMTSRYETEEKK